MKSRKHILAVLASTALLLLSQVQAAPGTGDPAPDRLGNDIDGNSISLANYPGRPVVISFWATWCAYCLQELPILEGIQKSAGVKSIQVIAINTETPQIFRQSARALSNLTLKLSYDSGKKASDAFGVKGIPHMVIIGRDGNIIRVYTGYDESSLNSIVADINTALAAPR